jgi:hypothetical protein
MCAWVVQGKLSYICRKKTTYPWMYATVPKKQAYTLKHVEKKMKMHELSPP